MKHRTAVICIMIFLVFTMAGCAAKAPEKKKIKIGVTLYDQYDTFIAQMMDAFNKDVFEKTSEGTEISVKSYNAAGSQQTQNEQVKEMIGSGCNVLCVNLVDRTAPTEIIDAARNADIPIIFFNRELVEEDLMQWNRLYYVGADAMESGIMQGEIAAVLCKTSTVDRNHDSLIQYIVLEGEAGHQDAIVRSEYSVSRLIQENVRLDKVGYAIANWDRAQAQTKMAQFIAEKGDKIELVLANNDDMALGAIDAYQAAKIERKNWPAIIGIDGTDVGLDAIANGTMMGTVYNDKEGQAKAIVELACRLAEGGSLDDLGLTDGKYIRLPYTKVTAANAASFMKPETD